jgi:large subunit ribosomal protein L1
MVKHGKRYNSALSTIEEATAYSPVDAIAITKKSATAKFDETIELHLRTGADPKHADQMVRGVANLPHGTGKQVRVLVFAQGDTINVAEEAGADFVGDDEVIKQIEGGWTEFDVSIATPEMMGKVGRLGRVLGRKGLMPNPRTGTVVPSDDIPRAITEAKKGRVEYRLDRSSLIHVPIGKASFGEEQLLDNLSSVMDAIVQARPPGLKGQYIRSSFISSTMGPSVRINVAELTELEVE